MFSSSLPKAVGFVEKKVGDQKLLNKLQDLIEKIIKPDQPGLLEAIQEFDDETVGLLLKLEEDIPLYNTIRRINEKIIQIYVDTFNQMSLEAFARIDSKELQLWPHAPSFSKIQDLMFQIPTFIVHSIINVNDVRVQNIMIERLLVAAQELYRNNDFFSAEMILSGLENSYLPKKIWTVTNHCLLEDLSLNFNKFEPSKLYQYIANITSPKMGDVCLSISKSIGEGKMNSETEAKAKLILKDLYVPFPPVPKERVSIELRGLIDSGLICEISRLDREHTLLVAICTKLENQIVGLKLKLKENPNLQKDISSSEVDVTRCKTAIQTNQDRNEKLKKQFKDKYDLLAKQKAKAQEVIKKLERVGSFLGRGRSISADMIDKKPPVTFVPSPPISPSPRKQRSDSLDTETAWIRSQVEAIKTTPSLSSSTSSLRIKK